MLTDYERYLLTDYLANAASRLNSREGLARNLVEWIVDPDNRDSFARRKRKDWVDLNLPEIDVSQPSDAALRCIVRTLRNDNSAKEAEPDRTALRLLRFGEAMRLDPTDVRILEFALRYKTHSAFESVIDDIFDDYSRHGAPLNVRCRALPLLLGLSPNRIQSRLQDDCPLVRSGAVSVDYDGEIQIAGRLLRLVAASGDENADVTSLLLDAASPGDLERLDFDHVADDRDHVETLVKGALDSDAPGVNILLYGPPGTGKTEFCKMLAQRLGATLYSIGEADEDGDEPTRTERLRELTLAQRLLAGNRRALLLFDEMDDLLSGPDSGFGIFGRMFSSGTRASSSKIFMNRLLEKTPAPTLWTMNDARDVSPAILRRMMFAFELRPPTMKVRARVWSRQLDRHGIEAAPEDVQALAAEFDAAPGVAAGATAAAHLAGGDIAAVRRGVESLSRVLSCGRPPQAAPAGFDPGLIRADTDPGVLADRLVSAGAGRFSLCLQGPPGTGKSACVRYLAERLGLEVVQKRASDLLSMWVGQTERQIARAFAEARDTGAFLVFDEADSLLADRRFAQRSWEVSQVNEMLTWMEVHPLPFACTTNFGTHLDPATLRRFVFKIALDYLGPEQANAAFRKFFSLPPPASLAALSALTPGDFAVVRRKAGLLGRLQDAGALAEMLRAECDAKPERPTAIGFRP
ncbi:MAG: AAA family ATPase [Rhodospirillaceae bacterium]|nr:AAA family ATPase [Rhodospirillaceae bacterium]MYI47950.1 AAA family ATPase [Rhodospirillaceae bacterium]